MGTSKEFPINILGGPMREYAPGKWENAYWPSDRTCTWTRTSWDGYDAYFQTSCGKMTAIGTPCDVGFSLAPKPSETYNFCYHCGGKIIDAKAN